jgi:hypothetical protein
MFTRVIFLFGFYLAGFAVVGAEACDDFSRLLFEPMDPAAVQLTAKQSRVLERIKNSPATLTTQLVRFNKHNLDDPNLPLVVPLEKNKEVELKFYRLTGSDKNGKRLEWKGPSQSVSLSILDDSLNGLIYVGDSTYSLQPLGDGLQVLARLDQSKFPPD